MRLRTTAVTGLTAMLLPLAAVVPALPAAAAECQSGSGVRGDIDGDGRADLAVGIPGRNTGRGAVDVRTTSARSKVITLGGGDAEPGDLFGATVVLADVNNDNCADLFIGAPGANGGSVYLVFGAPSGIRESGVKQIRPSPTKGNDGFGTAIALARRTNGPGYDLWISSPGDNILGVADAGSVRHYVVTRDGNSATIDLIGLTRQGLDPTPGQMEKNDFFGRTLSAAPGRVLIGTPRENVGNKTNAGTAVLLELDEDTGELADGTKISQAGDAPGKPEKGDRFGFSLSLGKERALIGAPAENVGNDRDAGWVQVYGVTNAGSLNPRRVLTQKSAGVPGKPEDRDGFGFSVVLGGGLVCGNGVAAAIGVPGEDTRGQLNAGMVTLVPLSNADDCDAVALQQGDELSGSPEVGDGVGASLALQVGGNDQVFIGAPGEDTGGKAQAGLVQLSPRASAPNKVARITINDTLVRSATFSAGARAGFTYGAVLASVSN